MTREIKFRQYINETAWAFHYFGWIDNGWISPIKLNFKTFPVEQYTGLTDRHGVKVYEGDIIRHELHPVNGSVSYFEGAFIWGVAISNNALINYNFPKFMEVIGNIHHDPELLD